MLPNSGRWPYGKRLREQLQLTNVDGMPEPGQYKTSNRSKAEDRGYAMLDEPAVAAWLKLDGFLETRPDQKAGGLQS